MIYGIAAMLTRTAVDFASRIILLKMIFRRIKMNKNFKWFFVMLGEFNS